MLNWSGRILGNIPYVICASVPKKALDRNMGFDEIMIKYLCHKAELLTLK